MADRSVNGTRRSCCARSSSNGWSSLARGDCAPRPRLAYAAEFTFVADGWQRSDGRMVRTTSAFFNALDQTRTRTVEHLAPGARDPAPVGSSLAALSGALSLAPTLCHFPVRYRTLFAATCAFSVAALLYDALYLTPYQVRWWPIAFGTLSPPRTDCSETLK